MRSLITNLLVDVAREPPERREPAADLRMVLGAVVAAVMTAMAIGRLRKH